MQIILLQNAQKNEISALLGQKFAIFYIFFIILLVNHQHLPAMDFQ